MPIPNREVTLTLSEMECAFIITSLSMGLMMIEDQGPMSDDAKLTLLGIQEKVYRTLSPEAKKSTQKTDEDLKKQVSIIMEMDRMLRDKKGED